MMTDLHIGFVTSDSHRATSRCLVRMGGYNQFRAHGLAVVDIARRLTTNPVVDIGETLSSRNLFPIGFDSSDDDLGVHFRSRVSSEMIKDAYKESTFEDFLRTPGKHIVIMLYTYVDQNYEYLRHYLTDPRLDGIIYYASDDEMYYPGYFLEKCLRSEYGIVGGLDYYSKIKDKLIMVISGHNYCKDYSRLTDTCIHLPMYPNMDYKRKVAASPEPKIKYDFFLNCFHDSRLLDRILATLDNRTFLIVTNDAVGNYIDTKALPKGTDVWVFDGRNITLDNLVTLIRQCKYYYLPNTYAHIHPWYHTHYTQDIMYTHKCIEAFYADRVIVGGDISDEAMRQLNEGELEFVTRYQKYDGDDPILSTIMSPDSSHYVNSILDHIKNHIKSWLQEKVNQQSS
jgi:hypothetical protein